MMAGEDDDHTFSNSLNQTDLPSVDGEELTNTTSPHSLSDPTMNSVFRTITTALRCNQDIWLRRNQAKQVQLQVFPHTALHMFDHHLHVSGIIPRTPPAPSSPNAMYEHDWYCASQAVICYPHNELMNWSLIPPTTADAGVAKTHVWVNNVGNSSIHFGSLLSVSNTVVAASRRVYVRKQRGSTNPAPFSDEEKFRLQEDCGMDEVILELMEQIPPGGTEEDMDADGILELPKMEKFGSFLPLQRSKGAEEPKQPPPPVLTVTVGLHHCNLADHAGHAFLASIALQALQMANVQPDSRSLAINYMAEVHVGQTLECMIQEDRVFVLVRKTPESPPVVAVVAKAL